MVEFLHTNAAHRTMFRTSRLLDFTSNASVLLLKDDFVVVKPFKRIHVFSAVCFNILLHMPRTNIARHEVSVITGQHQDRSNLLMIIIHVGVWQMMEAIENVNIKAAKSAGEVD